MSNKIGTNVIINNYYFNAEMWNLYVLILKDGKRYVGITKNITKRIEEHREGGTKAAEWVKENLPVVAIETTVNLGEISKEAAQKCERNMLIQLMNQYGTKNVRGWHVSAVDFQQALKLIEIRGIKKWIAPQNNEYVIASYNKRKEGVKDDKEKE